MTKDIEKNNINLDTLSLPEDLKGMTKGELEQLASQIRERLIEIGNACGGHLASNLGVVELTIALHAVFESPKDKLIWDTSHQTYVHKMLTGRLDKMFTIRQDGGLCGFANIKESDHDIFGAGHAATALSAGVGLAFSREMKKENHSVVSIINDATLSSGMVFEALNNIDRLPPKANFICILNDNNMFISNPVGSMAKYMTQVRTSAMYNKAKLKFERFFDRIPKIGPPLKHKIEKSVERFRDIILEFKVGVIFEEFGFKYLGPIDGHNIPMVMAAIKYAKNYQGPIMIHIVTLKGKGLQEAESNPCGFHGVSPKKKEPETKVVSTHPKAASFSKTFGEEMIKCAKEDPNLVVITPAMETGSGLSDFAREYPGQFVDVGIAEEHAVTFAAGLARDGKKPVLAIYSTFLQRGYDQIIHDVCLQELPVIFALDRAGLVGPDGPTHHGVFDYSFLLHIPNMIILAPKDIEELRTMVQWSAKQDKIISIRYPKAFASERSGSIQTPITQNKESECLYESKSEELDILFLSAGTLSWPTVDAATYLEENNITSAVINLRFIKPLDIKTIQKYTDRAKHVVVVEEGTEVGGIFSYILQSLKTEKPLNQFHQIAIPDRFIDHGKIETLHKECKLDTESIIEKAKEIVTIKVLEKIS